MKKTVYLCLCIPVIVLFFSTAKAQIITTFAGNGLEGVSGDGGTATGAEISLPYGMAFDASGNMYVASNNYDRIRKISPSGIISTVAGGDSSGYGGDGGAATSAFLSYPCGIATDISGNLYIADIGNSRIRMVNTSGIITTFAGSDSGGYSGDGGAATAARLGDPIGVSADGLGNVYIVDNWYSVVRKVNTFGVISTIVGNGIRGYSGDGGSATAAELNGPIDVKVDAAGNIYIADGNDVIRKVNTSGIINTIAGNGVRGYSGDGGPATAASLKSPWGLAIDSHDNIYIADYMNYVVRKVNPSGIISTVAGDGTNSFIGDGGPATAAEFDAPIFITVDSHDNLFISDEDNNRIRKVNTGTTNVKQTGFELSKIAAYPNPASNIIFISLSEAKGTIELQDISGRQVAEKKVTNTLTSFDIHSLARGIYFAVWNDGNDGKTTHKIVVE